MYFDVGEASPAAEVPSCSPYIRRCYKSPVAVVPEIESIESMQDENEENGRKLAQSDSRKNFSSVRTPVARKQQNSTDSPMPQVLPATPITPVVNAAVSSEQVVPQLTPRRVVKLNGRACKESHGKDTATLNEKPKGPCEVKDLLDIINATHYM